ncbi:MAG: hypothetical protein AAF717_12790 [Bacteroidota bacterium]
MEHQLDPRRKVEKTVEFYVKSGFKILFFIVFILLITLLVGYVVMWLWNWLIPDLFGVPTLNYWQAVGLLLLAKLFFGFGNGGPGKRSKKRRFKERLSNEKCGGWRRDFEDWKLYDQFWKAEGEQAFKNYVAKIKRDGTEEKTS